MDNVHLSLFIEAIHAKKKVSVTYFAEKHGFVITSLCAPFDYHSTKKLKNKPNKFHFWDYEGTGSAHNLSILPEDLHKIEITKMTFDPSDIVFWRPINWVIKRDWGIFS